MSIVISKESKSYLEVVDYLWYIKKLFGNVVQYWLRKTILHPCIILYHYSFLFVNCPGLWFWIFSYTINTSWLDKKTTITRKDNRITQLDQGKYLDPYVRSFQTYLPQFDGLTDVLPRSVICILEILYKGSKNTGLKTLFIIKRSLSLQ